MFFLFSLKKRILKFLEKGLGLYAVFRFAPENSMYVNFALSEDEKSLLQATLPAGYELKKIRICEEELEEQYWISYNIYHLEYGPQAKVPGRKIRCEINAFVQDAAGRTGCWVCLGSPFVNKEPSWRSLFSMISNAAEHLVMWCYGSGRFAKVQYTYTPETTSFCLQDKESSVDFDLVLEEKDRKQTLFTSQFLHFNTSIFFSEGKVRDDLYFNNTFANAKVLSLNPKGVKKHLFKNSIFAPRSPNSIYVVEKRISFLVDSLNSTKL